MTASSQTLKMKLGFAWALVNLHYRLQRTNAFSLALELGSAASSFLLVYFLSRIVDGGGVDGLSQYGGDYLSFALVGYIVTGFASLAIYQPSSWVREMQITGTLESILIDSRVSTAHVLVFSNVYPMLKSWLRTTIYLVTACLLLDLQPTLGGLMATAIAMVCIGLSFLSLGVLGGAFVLIYRRNNPFLQPLASISMLLGGVLYPIEILPSSLQAIADFIPLSHALSAVRAALLDSSPLLAVLPPCLILALLGLVSVPFTVAMVRKSLVVAKREGWTQLH